MQIPDLIQSLGYLALGTRMKRIGEALQAGAAEAFAGDGVAIQPGQVGILIALDRSGPLTVGELVVKLGISQPGVSRSLGELASSGLVELASDASDRRVRTASLTAAGRELTKRVATSLSPRVDAAAAELCGDLDGQLLDILTTIDARLAAEPFGARVARQAR